MKAGKVGEAQIHRFTLLSSCCRTIRAHQSRRDAALFHFVTEGVEAALRAARNKDVGLGGGVSTIRQYLQLGLVDEVHLTISPVLLGARERLLSGLDLPRLGYRVTEHVPSVAATHIVLTK